MPDRTALVIGAGIVGLATARSLALNGYSVTVLERHARAVGASIRNFGMIWPIGQPDGVLYERALRSRSVWEELCTGAGLWYEKGGSLHLAYRPEEWDVLREFAEASGKGRPVRLLDSEEAAEKSSAVQPQGLLGALWSEDELIIESRVAMERLPAYFTERYGITFHFGRAVTSIEYPWVTAGGERYMADRIVVCSGTDFETLYPEQFRAAPLTTCQLQMMRLQEPPGGMRTGPSLCGGLSLIHYKSFAGAPSLERLQQVYAQERPEYLEHGIHVMMAQNQRGELTVGDSHAYGAVHLPFDNRYINDLILDYLKTFTRLPRYEISQTWNGVYAKMTNGATEYITGPEPGVTIINGVGGAGMTLSFGLAEEWVRSL
ncbi:MAG TPA: TIGR03364 family FAD-dependent oxidoreductase [Chitinophagaceae bacterium]|nr:TIGR03364 family FAD-dependent oxidoreductase [Chitinophagaceae bacterium]